MLIYLGQPKNLEGKKGKIFHPYISIHSSIDPHPHHGFSSQYVGMASLLLLGYQFMVGSTQPRSPNTWF